MSYVDEVLARVKAKNASEPEFLQAVRRSTGVFKTSDREAHEEQYKKKLCLRD